MDPVDWPTLPLQLVYRQEVAPPPGACGRTCSVVLLGRPVAAAPSVLRGDLPGLVGRQASYPKPGSKQRGNQRSDDGEPDVRIATSRVAAL
jgi:hypothetical protein